MKNDVLTPHMAGSTPHHWDRCAEMVAEGDERFQADDLDSMPIRIV